MRSRRVVLAAAAGVAFAAASACSSSSSPAAPPAEPPDPVAPDTPCGDGFTPLEGGDVSATIEESTISGSKGIGLAVASAGAFVSHSVISRNAVGIHAQDGTVLVTGDAPGDPLALVVSSDTSFVANEVRVGSGTVPLPKVLTR